MDDTLVNNNLFEEYLLEEFKKGDFVSWKRLGTDEKEYGFVQKIYYEERGENRKFAFANVMKTSGKTEPFMLSYLTRESNQK